MIWEGIPDNIPGTRTGSRCGAFGARAPGAGDGFVKPYSPNPMGLWTLLGIPGLRPAAGGRQYDCYGRSKQGADRGGCASCSQRKV